MTSTIVAEDVDRILSEPIPWREFAGGAFLVTGATGMIGQYVVRTLLALRRNGSPIKVIALARSRERAQQLFGTETNDGALTIVAQDVSAPIVLQQRPDFIVHAASPANPAAFETDPIGVIRANVAGTENVLSLAAAGRARVCFLSSSEIYGTPLTSSARDGPLLAEDSLGGLDPLALRSAYPQSKRMAETLCVAYGAQHGVQARIARLSYTYGPGMDLQDARVQAYCFRQALRGQDIVLQSDGATRRMYTYVSDAVSALFYLLSGPDNLTCNIANEAAQVSIADLARLILRAGATDRVVRTGDQVPAGRGLAASALLDCARIRGLGWRARIDLETGIARTLRHHGLEQQRHRAAGAAEGL